MIRLPGYGLHGWSIGWRGWHYWRNLEYDRSQALGIGPIAFYKGYVG